MKKNKEEKGEKKKIERCSKLGESPQRRKKTERKA